MFLPSGITETKIIRDPETGQDFLQIKFESNSGLNTLSYSSDVPLDLQHLESRLERTHSQSSHRSSAAHRRSLRPRRSSQRTAAGSRLYIQ